MLRRIALALVPSVALYTIAAICAAHPAVGTQLEISNDTDAPASVDAPQIAARSGYIVASS